MQNSAEYNSERIRKDATDLISQADKIFANSSKNKNELSEIRELLQATGVPTETSTWLANITWLVRKGCGYIAGDEKGTALEVCERLEKALKKMEKQNEDVRNVSLVAKQLGNGVKTMSNKMDKMQNQMNTMEAKIDKLLNALGQNQGQSR